MCYVKPLFLIPIHITLPQNSLLLLFTGELVAINFELSRLIVILAITQKMTFAA